MNSEQTIKDNNKRIAKNTIMLYLRMFLSLVVGLYTSRVILRVLGINDFGIYNVVGGLVSMMTVLNSAMSVSTTRYLTFELGKNDLQRLKQVFSICVTIYAILALIFIFLAETIGLWFLNNKLTIPDDRIVAANWVYQFTILTVVNNLLSNPYNAVLIAREKMDIFAYITIIEVILKLVIVYLLLIIPFDRMIVYGGLMFLLMFSIMLFYRIYCTKHYPESCYIFYWDKRLFNEINAYSGWNLFGSASAMVKGQGLNILLNMFFSPAVNASRGIAYQVNNHILQFFTNFYMAVRPQITKYYAQNDLDNMFKLVFRSSKFSFFLILLISLPILIEAPYIINLWLGQLPDYVVPFIRIIVVISAIDSMSNPLMTTAQATGRIAFYQSLVGTLTMMNIPISYCILKYFDGTPIVVFIVSLIISILALFCRLLVVKRLIPSFPSFKYLKDVLVVCFIISFLSSLLPLFIHIVLPSGFGTSFLNIILSICSAGAVIYIYGLTKEERNVVISIIRNKIRHK